VFVDVTKYNYYSNVPPYRTYGSDFIVDSGNPNTVNQLTITLPQPTQALGIDYGGLGFSGASTGNITLSNGHVLRLASLPTVGSTQFSGFISSTPFSSLTYTVNNDNWVVTDLLLGTPFNATEGSPYTQVLLEQGGVGPVTFTLKSGALPTGITLSPNGILNGTPTASGAYTFTIQLADSSNPQKTLISPDFTMSVVPQPPTNLQLTTYPYLLLTWTLSLSNDITAYNIYRGANSGGPYAKIGSSTGDASSFVDNTYQSGGTYFYVVTAAGANGVESVYSNEREITP
jgi:hypothetical protein